MTATPPRGRRRWLAILIRFATTQALVQALAFTAGILIVRSLDKSDYAYYAIVVSITAAAATLTDSGISSTLLSAGSKYLDDPRRLGSLFSTGQRFRTRFALPIVVLAIALLVLLLIQNGAAVWLIVLLAVLVAATVTLTLWMGIVQTYLRLQMRFSPLQAIALQSALLRLAAVGGLVALGALNLGLAVGIALLAAVFEFWRMRHAARELDWRAAEVGDDRQLLRSNVAKTLPMTLLLVAQGQLLYVLLGFAGTTDSIAEIAALSRFALAFVVLNTIVSDISSGVIARAPNTPRAVLRVYATNVGLYLACATAVVLLAAVFATPLVTLLGPSYRGLEGPLVVVAVGSALINSGNALRTMNFARGWLSYSWVYIPLTGLWVALGAFVLDLSNIWEASILMAAQAIPGIVTQTTCFLVGMHKLRKAQDPNSS